MHITASAFINDDERSLHADYEDWLEELAPYEPISRYRHTPAENQARYPLASLHQVDTTIGRTALSQWIHHYHSPG